MARRRFVQWIILGFLVSITLMEGQGGAQGNRTRPETRKPAVHGSTAEEARRRMVDEEIVAAGVKNSRVIAAMRATPRHEFVPTNLLSHAYYDMALPIGEGQTISPPFVVAFMTEAIDPQPKDRVLEIGTGSGYQAAVLSGLVQDVYTIEIVESLGKHAAKTLKRLNYENVYTKVGDGYLGWPERAPFDKIIVTCSPEKVPQALVDQLKEGGRIVIPVGQRYQQTLYLLKKAGGKMLPELLLPVIFVPMTGKAEENRQVKPDPKNPTVQNGDFEQVFGDPPQAAAWHYQRQMEVVAADDAPSGRHYIRFHNAESGRGAQALQAFAVDGRYVRQLEVSVHVRYHDIHPGPTAVQLPMVGVQFYDENRGTICEKMLGPWRGSSDWKIEAKKIDVPVRAREAIVRIGLFGATGELSMDDLQVKGLP
ncbi:MAG: protein-L-isoaspartate(D-aspartate) O-methyltransferase [Planctomycetota bacterium]